MEEPIVVAELRQREHPWQKPEKYIVHMSDGEAVTYVPERTCHMNLVKDGSIFDVWKFDCCGFEFAESGCERGQTEMPGTCCPNCGAKVVEE